MSLDSDAESASNYIMPTPHHHDMNKQQPPMGIRLPDDLRAWIKQVAAASRRSVNSEVIVRLEASRKADQDQQQAPKS